jgi:hypothetical protein
MSRAVSGIIHEAFPICVNKPLTPTSSPADPVRYEQTQQQHRSFTRVHFLSTILNSINYTITMIFRRATLLALLAASTNAFVCQPPSGSSALVLKSSLGTSTDAMDAAIRRQVSLSTLASCHVRQCRTGPLWLLLLPLPPEPPDKISWLPIHSPCARAPVSPAVELPTGWCRFGFGEALR